MNTRADDLYNLDDGFIHCGSRDCVAYKCCRDCDYTWDTIAEWEAGKGRVAFSYPAEDIEDDDVVCSLCYKGVEEYFPSDDEFEDSDEDSDEDSEEAVNAQ